MIGDVATVLRRHPAFAEASSSDLTALVRRAQYVRFSEHDVLFAEGHPGDALYIVLAGTVRVAREGEDGSEVVLAEVGPGGILGEMGMLDPAPRSATAHALCSGEALVFLHDEFDDLLWEGGDVGRSLLAALTHMLAARTLRTDEDVAALVAASSREQAVDHAREVWRLIWACEP